MSSFKTIEWQGDKVVILDQTKLPNEEVYVVCETYEDVAEAIKSMIIRGAPAIGVAAAMGIALGACKINTRDKAHLIIQIREIVEAMQATRPTAVNLFWAAKRMLQTLYTSRNKSMEDIKEDLIKEASAILREDIDSCKNLGRLGAHLIENNSVLLTHCNAGALATAGYGTALGVIRAANGAGKNVKVIATETRPFLQGARLTAWELDKDGISVLLITDGMVGHVMSKGTIDAVVVGADRIASNGDVANKIGTYSISVLAKAHGIPFYVAAPVSTIDYKCPDGNDIPIEERNASEVTHISGKKIAPDDVDALNPSFDITPNENVTAIITERGIVQSPFSKTLLTLR